MANNSNQKFPAYVESDLNKGKIAVPPRHKKRERQIYIYATNQKIDVIESNASAIAIATTFIKQMQLNPIGNLPNDLSGFKNENLSISQTWGGKLSGYIYDNLDQLNTQNYNFITFATMSSHTAPDISKFRIVGYSPVYDGQGRFLYAELSLIAENKKTFPTLNRVTWNLTSQVILDAKTKNIKITFPSTAKIFASGLKVSLLDDAGIQRVAGLTIISAPQLTTRLMNVRSVNPFKYDDMTIKNLASISKSFGKSGEMGVPPLKKGLFWLQNEPPSWGIQPYKWGEYNDTHQYIDPLGITFKTGGFDVDNAGSGFKNYFSGGYVVSGSRSNNVDNFNDSKNKTIIISQRELNSTDIANFLSGSYTIEGEPVEGINSKLEINNSKEFADLDLKNSSDKHYFTLTKPFNFIDLVAGSWTNQTHTDLFDGNESTWAELYYKGQISDYNLLDSSSANKNGLSDKNDNIEFYIELSIEGKNPKIEIEAVMADQVTISTYDSGHGAIYQDVVVETDYKFNNNNVKTTIQL